MANSTARVAPRALVDRHIMNAEPLSISGSTARLGRIAILWRGDEAARRSARPDTSRFKTVFAALADVAVDAEPVVYEDDVLDAVRAQLATFDGVLVWVNPIHEGRNRANLDALLREVAARGVGHAAHARHPLARRRFAQHTGGDGRRDGAPDLRATAGRRS